MGLLTMKNIIINKPEIQVTETQIESYIETLNKTVIMLNNKINELKKTLLEIREGRYTSIKDLHTSR
jgi:hypothetical protein